MEAQSGKNVEGGYTLENVELEYETIDNTEIYNEISKKYMEGRTLSYEHVTLLKSVKWDKGIN